MFLLLLVPNLLLINAQSDSECLEIICFPQNSSAKCTKFPDQKCLLGETGLYYCCPPKNNDGNDGNTFSSTIRTTGTHTQSTLSTTPKVPSELENGFLKPNNSSEQYNKTASVNSTARPDSTTSAELSGETSAVTSTLPIITTVTKLDQTSTFPTSTISSSRTSSSTATTSTLVATTTTATTTEAVKKGCELGWTSWNGNCYFVGEGDEIITGTDAEFKCNFNDSELTDIETPDELQFLGELAEPGGHGYLFVGLKRTNGQFLYKNGNSIGYIHWCGDEPNGPVGTQHTCGFLEVTKDGPCLGDNYCYNKIPRFICKKEESALTTECEPGWKSWNGNCYLIRKGSHIEASDAEAACESMNAEITDINSAEELDFIGRLAKANDGGLYPLVGLKRINSQFLYKNQTSIGFVHWCPGEPNNPWSAGDLCSFIRYHDLPKYCIADGDCHEFTSYICKKEQSR